MSTDAEWFTSTETKSGSTRYRAADYDDKRLPYVRLSRDNHMSPDVKWYDGVNGKFSGLLLNVVVVVTVSIDRFILSSVSFCFYLCGIFR